MPYHKYIWSYMTCHFMQTFIKQVKIQSFIYDEFDKKKNCPRETWLWFHFAIQCLEQMMSFKVFYYTCLTRYLQWLYYTRHKQHHAICIHKITTVVDPMLTIVLSHLWCISALKRGKSCGIDNLIPEVVIESSKIIHCDSIKTRIPL